MPYTAMTLTDMDAVTPAVLTDDLAAVDNANGNSFVNNGRVLLAIVNGSGGALTVTLDTPYTLDSLELTDNILVIGIGDEVIVGPFPTRSYNQKGANAGLVHVDWSTGTTVTAVAIQYS